MPNATQPARLITAIRQTFARYDRCIILSETATPETRKQMEPRQSGLQTRRSYSFVSSPVCSAWNVLTLKNSVPANWTTHDHRSRPPPLCSIWSSAADVKKTEPAKKTAASTSEPTSSTKPGSGPTRKHAEPIANSTPIHRVTVSAASVAVAVSGAALIRHHDRASRPPLRHSIRMHRRSGEHTPVKGQRSPWPSPPKECDDRVNRRPTGAYSVFFLLAIRRPPRRRSEANRRPR